MLFNFALILSLLLVSAVSKNLHTRIRGTSLAARRVPVPTNDWGGAILPGDFTEVSAIIKVPVPHGSSGSAGSAWVGMDGTNSCKGLLRTGIGFSLDDTGTPNYGAWYQWREQGNALMIPYDDFSLAAGHLVKFTVGKYNSTSGYVKVENLSYNSANEVKTRLVSSQVAPLCGKSVEWIVEEYRKEDDDGSVVDYPFVDFRSVTFTEATAIGSNGPITPEDGAVPVNIIQSNRPVTGTVIDGSYVRVQYLG